MKKLIPILLAVFALVSCEKDPPGHGQIGQ